jgi:spermidine synthase
MMRPRLSLICPLVFLSGLAGLGYQMVWSRQFGMGLGTEMASVLAVVCAFLGGMAVGAWLFDQPLSRTLHPGRWYAAFEGLIGFWAIATTFLIPALQSTALELIGLEPSFLRHWLVAFLVPFLVLLPATAAMGATLPALDRWMAPLCPDQRTIGLLYAVNTAGAVCGTLLSAFVIVPAIGFRNAVWIFSGINLICGLGAALLQRPVDPKKAPQEENIISKGAWARLFAVGFLGIGYEVVGIRALSQVLENTVYTFALVLAVYLLGTALGAAIYHRFFRARSFSLLLQHLLAGLASACLLGGLVLSKGQMLYDHWRNPPVDSLSAEVFLALLVFGIPTLFMGATFSHLVQHCRRARGGVGLAAAWNILGGTSAPFCFGILLVPWLGVRWCLLLISVGYLVVRPKPFRASWVMLVPVGLAAALSLLNFQTIQVPPGATIALWKEGIAATVAVLEDPSGNRTLRINNRFQMGGTGAAAAEYRHAHIPLLLHPHPRTALVLGLGTGISLGGTIFHPDLMSEGVELLPEVIEVMPQFEPFNFSPAHNPRLRLHAADARRFARASTNQYDVIISDLFHPAMDGAGALYTVEHFQAIRQRLTPGGVFCQWLPLHQLDENMLRVITRTFLQVFPDAQAYLLRFNVDAPVLGLVGFMRLPSFGPDWIESRVQTPELAGQLKEQSLGDSVRFFGCLLAGREELRAYAGNAPLNTDNFPRVIFGAPQLAHQKDATSYGRLISFLKVVKPNPQAALRLKGGVEGEKFAARLAHYYEAREVYLQGLVEQTEGRMDEALTRFVESARLSEDFTSGSAHVISVASLLARTKPSEAKALLERLAAAQPSQPVARQLLQRLFGN